MGGFRLRLISIDKVKVSQAKDVDQSTKPSGGKPKPAVLVFQRHKPAPAAPAGFGAPAGSPRAKMPAAMARAGAQIGYFHGGISREVAEELLSAVGPGGYLVRGPSI